MFDLVDKAFHQMTCLVQSPVSLAGFSPIFAGWNNGESTLIFDVLDQISRIIGSISNHCLKIKLFQQNFSSRGIVCLPTSEVETHRIPQSINRCVDLGAEPTTATT